MNPQSTVRGYEILEFDSVDLSRTDDKTNETTYLDANLLKVLYFPEFQRFILHLGNLSLVLLQRLKVVSSSKSNMKSRTYTFYINNGFYSLQISKIPFSESIQNFETILSHSCNFFYQGDVIPVIEGGMSPTFMPTGGSENLPSSTVPSSETSESQSSKYEEPKKSLFSKAAHTLSRVLGGSGKKNLNMMTLRSIDELRNVDQDFLSMH